MIQKNQMEWKIIQPAKRVVNITGKIFYREAMQAWNTIRLRKELISEFPVLKEKRSSFSYQMIFHREYEDLEKELRKMKRDKLPPPVLLFFRKGVNQG